MDEHEERIVRSISVAVFFRKIAKPSEMGLSSKILKGMKVTARTMLDRELESRCLRCGADILHQFADSRNMIHLCKRCNERLMKEVQACWRKDK